MENTEHPVVSMAFFNTSAKETEQMRAIYDELTSSDPTVREKLTSLMHWAGQQRSCDDAYNNTNFSPD